MEPITILKNEKTTPDNPIKVYYFGWIWNGRKCGYGNRYNSPEAAIEAAVNHRAKKGNTGYHILGLAIAGFAF